MYHERTFVPTRQSSLKDSNDWIIVNGLEFGDFLLKQIENDDEIFTKTIISVDAHPYPIN